MSLSTAIEADILTLINEGEGTAVTFPNGVTATCFFGKPEEMPLPGDAQLSQEYGYAATFRRVDLTTLPTASDYATVGGKRYHIADIIDRPGSAVVIALFRAP